MSGWHAGPMLALDTETTGPDPETARIVTACVALIDGTGKTPPKTSTWLVDPGVDIPAEAAEIHGVTSERARAQGVSAAVGVAMITEAIVGHIGGRRIPLVIFNAPYDLTVLDRECRRYDVPTLDRQLGGEPYVIDPYVLDKHVDRYRKGSRKLTHQCTYYGVRIDGAHDAAHDALACARVGWKIAARYPALAKMPLDQLHELQVKARGDQCASLQTYLRRKNQDPLLVVKPDWPLIPYAGQAELGGAS